MFFEKILWSFQGFISVPCQPSGRRGIPSGHSSVSNIHPDDEIFLSGRPSMSRSFEQFKVSSVRRKWHIVQTLFRVRENPSAPSHPSGRRGYTIRTPFNVWQEIGFLPQDTVMGRRLLPFGRCVIPSERCPLYGKNVHTKFNRLDVSLHGLDNQACIHPDVLAACLDASQHSISFWFLSKFQEREDQSTVWTMWYPVRTSDSYGLDACSSKKEIADSTSTVRTTAYHGPDARITDMEMACWRIAVRTLIPHGPDAREPYKEITCSGRATVRTMSLNRKDFSAKISENLFAQLSVRTVPRYILPDAHLSLQPINRGPWALRTARIRCEFH